MSDPSRACALLRLALAESLLELDRSREAIPLLEIPVPFAEAEARRLADMPIFGTVRVTGPRIVSPKAARVVSAAARDVQGKIDLLGGMLHMNSDQLADAESSFRRAIAAVGGSNTLIETYALIDLDLSISAASALTSRSTCRPRALYETRNFA